MALGGLQKKQGLHVKSRGNVNEKVKWQKSKKKNEDEKKGKIKGGALMSWVWPWEIWDHPHGLNALKERCALLFKLESSSHTLDQWDRRWNEENPAWYLGQKQLFQMYTHAQLIYEIRNSHKECGRCSTYPPIAAQTGFSLSSQRNDVFSSHSSGRPLIRSFVIMRK